MAELRHTVITHNQFQHRIILQTVLMTFITLNLVIILGYLLSDLFDFYDLSTTMLAVSISVVELAALAIVYLISRKISFRIAGPLYAMEKRLKSMADGDVTLHLTLRKDDYLHEVSDILNNTVDTFHDHINKTKNVAERLKSELPKDSEAYNHVKELLAELAFFDSNSEPAQK